MSRVMDPFLLNLLRLDLTLGDIGDLIIPQINNILRPWVLGDEFLLIVRVWLVIFVILIVFPNLARRMIEPPALSVPILVP